MPDGRAEDDHGRVQRPSLPPSLERADSAATLPRLGGMARPNGVVIVSERFWAFAGTDGSLRTGEIPGTGHIERILFNEKMQELRREALLTELRQRVRDIRQSPDGFLYVLTDEKDGAVLRIEPAP